LIGLREVQEVSEPNPHIWVCVRKFADYLTVTVQPNQWFNPLMDSNFERPLVDDGTVEGGARLEDMGQWGSAFEGTILALAPSYDSSLLPGCHEVNSFLHHAFPP
jgi:hypothetical protein